MSQSAIRLERDLLTFGAADIQRDRHLVAVHADEIRALLGSGHERRSEAAGIVTGSGPLDLDHVGAQITQHLRAGGSRENTGKVEYAQPLERPRRGIGHAGLQLPGDKMSGSHYMRTAHLKNRCPPNGSSRVGTGTAGRTWHTRGGIGRSLSGAKISGRARARREAR